MKAPAKVNLFLEVLGRRSNGYHDIRSVMVPISLFDEVEIERTDGEIACDMRNGASINGSAYRLPPPTRNLAHRAAVALKEATGCADGLRIAIRKHIPLGGGLGGGSSDAAAVLVHANRMWGTGVTSAELMALGSRLGCDIPALIHGGAVCVEGLGDCLSSLQPGWHGCQQGWWLVVLNPRYNISTREVYEHCSASLTSEDDKFKCIVSALEEGDLALAARSLHNGLQETVLKKYPLVGILCEELTRAGAEGVLMSGSGASVFGLARDEGHAREIAAQVGANVGFAVWSIVARTLPDGVMAAHGPLEARV